MRNSFIALSRPGFVRSVGLLVGGTAFTQALMVLVLPLLTRLYTPEDFSMLAVYLSILGIISVAACLRLEIAIPLPHCDEDAANLLALALCSSAGIAALSMFIVALFSVQIVTTVAQPKLQPYLWLLPFGVWLSSSYAALQFWAARKKRFAIITKTRIAQAVGGASTQVGLGCAAVAPLGLLLGQLISNAAGILGLARDVAKNDRAAIRAVKWSNMRRLFCEYDRFPKYSTLDSLLNTVGAQLPVIIIAALAMGPEAGYLLLTLRVMQVPLGLIGGAVAQVYLSRAPEELRAGTLARFTVNILGGLIETGVGPLLFIGILAPNVFTLVFGPEWQRAGDLVAWLTPWSLLQLLSSPISMVMQVTGRQREMLLLMIVGLFFRIGPIFISARCAPGTLAEVYAISSAVFYLLLCIVFYWRSGCLKYRAMSVPPRIFILPMLWTISAILLAIAINLLR